uniref:Uncharacterized protein n=1 Tax=Acrobeloides nanus TaxID=290746 RepID=A0A914DAZ4_9BILA
MVSVGYARRCYVNLDISNPNVPPSGNGNEQDCPAGINLCATFTGGNYTAKACDYGAMGVTLCSGANLTNGGSLSVDCSTVPVTWVKPSDKCSLSCCTSDGCNGGNGGNDGNFAVGTQAFGALVFIPFIFAYFTKQ